MNKSLLSATIFALLLSGAPLFAEEGSGSSLPIVSKMNAPTSAEEVAPPKKKRFFRATAEMIVIGYSPWLYSHYIKDFDYADISMDTVRRNFEEDPEFDKDSFQTNQWGHPFQGSLYFNAARENGFNFWESVPFVLVGDLGWEYLMEAELPSYNDMANTFFGGIARGEMTHRLSVAVRDNRASGSERFWREFGAGVLNPVGFLDRMIFGDMWKKGPNPANRLPEKLFLMVDAGYQRGREFIAHPNQGYAGVVLRHNDPHEDPIEKPFQYFDFEGKMSLAKGPLIPLISYRGLLAGWEMSDDGDAHHLLAPGLTYDYFNNTHSAFGGQGLDMTLLSKWPLQKDFELRSEVGVQGYIFAGIQIDYEQDSLSATGRNYDFGSGGGPKIDLRIRREQVDWFRFTTAVGWFPTNNGISTQSRIFLVNAEARYPLTKDLYAGLGWVFQERQTLYDHVPSVTESNSGIKAFLSWAFRVLG